MKIPDKRHMLNGSEITTEGYCDQPYVVKDSEGAWVCVITAGAGKEGASGQHVVTCRSGDRGKTWNTFADLEPADGPESSYGVLLRGDNGRIYCFYNYNIYREKGLITDELAKYCGRMDTMGSFVFKYSDDGGRSWSDTRIEISVREMEIDREHSFPGIRFFWTVGNPFSWEGKAYVPLYKVGDRGDGWFTRSEGVLLESPDLLRLDDPVEAGWITLPDGDRGIHAPEGAGSISEEHSFVPLSDGTFYCIFRTYSGYPGNTVSRDFGRTWSEPKFLTYADGSRVKNPRAANFVWKCANGNYLYWFHNNGGSKLGEKPDALWRSFSNRNPAWLSGGVETNTVDGRTIAWSQPEIAVYDDDPVIRMSYPDLIEEPEMSGRSSFYIFETQKATARVHEISPDLLAGMWNQHESMRKNEKGLIVDLSEDKVLEGAFAMPDLPEFTVRDSERRDHGALSTRAGISLEIRFSPPAEKGYMLICNTDGEGVGFALRINEKGCIVFCMNDGQSRAYLDSDTPVAAGEEEYLTIIVDSGPSIVSFVRNGRLQDGGDFRQFGWGRFNPSFLGLSGDTSLRVASGSGVRAVKLYDRAITVSEAVANWKNREV